MNKTTRKVIPTGIMITGLLVAVSLAGRIQLPYGGGPQINSTFGQLSKLSEYVLVGTLESIPSETAENLDLTLTVEQVLLGGELSYTVGLQASSFQVQELEPPQRVLIFASSKALSLSITETYRWGWTEKNVPPSENSSLRILDAQRAIIPLDESNTNIVPIVEEYLANLRDPSGDAAKYFQFLHDLLEVDDERVRNDARVDLVFLCRYLDADTLLTLCYAHDNMDPEIRDYAKGIADWKRSGQPVNIRDLTPNESQVEQWLAWLQSEDTSKKIDAFLELMEGGRRDWLKQSTSVWVSVVAKLVDHPDSTVRFASAELLSHVGDTRATPVLLEGLESDREQLRKEFWEKLKKLYGEPVTYNPQAGEADRKAAAARWKEWYQNH